jgi:hypothetical protein
MARVRIPLNRTKASQLPAVCIVCGADVDAHVAKLFSWRPGFLSLGFWLGLFMCPAVALAIAIVGFLSTRRVKVECPVCERHRSHWSWRAFWTTAPLLVITAADLAVSVLILTTAFLTWDAFSYLLFGTAAAIGIWAVFAKILQNTSVRVDEITDDDIRLTGVDPGFADLLRYERDHDRSAPDFGWEDYDPYPRRSALP